MNGSHVVLRLQCTDHDSEEAFSTWPISDSEYFVSEIDGRLRTNKVNFAPTNDDERFRTFPIGCLQLDAKVNTMIKGSMSEEKNESLSRESWLLGTSSGEVLELSKISSALFRVLSIIEAFLSENHTGLGGFKHREWRYPLENSEVGIVPLVDHKYMDDRKSFVDGEFLKLFLDLPYADQEKLLQ